MLAVANFHYIRLDFRSDYPSIFGVTPSQFEAQLDKLSAEAAFISQEDLLQYRDKHLKKNYILITFDDGLKEQYDLARPILERKGIPFIFFINTSVYTENQVSLVHKIHLLRSHIPPQKLKEAIENQFSIHLDKIEKIKAAQHYNYDNKPTAYLKYLLNFKLSFAQQEEVINPLFKIYFDERSILEELYMDVRQLKNLQKSGFLASHGHYHNPLGLQDKDNLKSDLNRNQSFFVDNFGEKASSISYPYGSKSASAGIQ
ncbi:MAG: polysaccharide deacetylase family protein, partial [Leeuwenhoekiella sp.]